MLAKKASGVYLAENCPIVECPLLLSDGVALSGTAGVTVVGLTKVRPLTRVPAVGNGDSTLDDLGSLAGTDFASTDKIEIGAVGIGRPTEGVPAVYVDQICADRTRMRSHSSSSTGVSYSALRSASASASRGIV